MNPELYRVFSHLAVLMLIFSGTTAILAQGHELDAPVIPVDIGQPAPDFELTDQDGNSFSLESFRGKVIVLTFIYTRCPDVCPLFTANMKQVQERLGDAFGEDVAFVSISFDPNDTPEVLKTYAVDHGADVSGWRFLTSPSEDEMKHVTEAYGYLYQKEEGELYSHIGLTYLIDQDLIVTKQYLGTFLSSNRLFEDISELTSPPSDVNMYLLGGLVGGVSLIGAVLYLRRKNAINFRR